MLLLRLGDRRFGTGRFVAQSGSAGGKAVGSACQTAKMFPSGSATTAYQAVFGTAVFPRTTVPPSSVTRATASSTDGTET